MALVEAEGAKAPPLALRDASGTNRRNLGHGTGYVNPHGVDGRVTGDSCMPEGMEHITFFEPGDVGTEAAYWARLREMRAKAQRGASSDTMPPAHNQGENG